MALIVEDGSGRADAESPQSIEALDAYHSARSNASWTSADTPAKEAAARKASDFQEGTWGGRLNGVRKTYTQRLSFPRLGCTFADGRPVPDAVTADPWLAAHAELSARALVNDLAPDLARGGQIKRDVTGPLETEYFDGAPSGTTYTIVETILRTLLHANRDVAAAFSRRWLAPGEAA